MYGSLLCPLYILPSKQEIKRNYTQYEHIYQKLPKLLNGEFGSSLLLFLINDLAVTLIAMKQLLLYKLLLFYKLLQAFTKA